MRCSSLIASHFVYVKKPDQSVMENFMVMILFSNYFSCHKLGAEISSALQLLALFLLTLKKSDYKIISS